MSPAESPDHYRLSSYPVTLPSGRVVLCESVAEQERVQAWADWVIEDRERRKEERERLQWEATHHARQLHPPPQDFLAYRQRTRG